MGRKDSRADLKRRFPPKPASEIPRQLLSNKASKGAVCNLNSTIIASIVRLCFSLSETPRHSEESSRRWSRKRAGDVSHDQASASHLLIRSSQNSANTTSTSTIYHRALLSCPLALAPSASHAFAEVSFWVARVSVRRRWVSSGSASLLAFPETAQAHLHTQHNPVIFIR